MVNRISRLVIAVLLAAAATACGGEAIEENAPRGGLPALPGGDLDRGTYLGALAYGHYCAVCHGENGTGNGTNSTLLEHKPTDLTALLAEGRRNRVVAVTRDGSAAHGGAGLCPAWGRSMSEERIGQLADFLEERSRQAPREE